MKKAEVCDLIQKIGIIPAIRVSSAEDAHFAADSIMSGGIPIVEITMTIPEAVKLMAHLVQHHDKITVGAGTVLTADMAKQCVDVGACFLTSPGLSPRVVEFAVKNEIAILPGALTPSEIIEAREAGADFVKVFPCAQVGGHEYIRALKTALPRIPLIAAGGVTQQTAANYILAGATALGVGKELIPADAIQRREADRLRELAQRWVGFVNGARDRLEPLKTKVRPKKTDFEKLHHNTP